MAVTTSARQADHALASLPTRPPTPPKEASSRIASTSIKPAVRQALVHQSLQTPPNIQSLISPTTTESQSSVNRLRKKVEWSAHTEYKEPPQYQEGARLAKSSPVASGTVSRPIKSILKASSSPCQPSASFNTRLGSLSDQTSISDMLDSTIKQLSGADRDSKVDAYMALARALKSSNNLPDRVALQGKLSLLTQFIQRDITLKDDHGALDRSLVNHALLLLTTFLQFNAIASTIPSDFAIFITDHAIRSFEDPAMPKEVVRYLMQVMAFQTFAPKVMSHDRVGRLVLATHNLEGHLSGKSIVMSRIQLYRRLVKQCPHHMVAHSHWLRDLLTDMLSLTKEIRTEAISLGSDAGFQLRHEKQILRHFLDILQGEAEEKTFVQHYIERLQEMLKDRERSAAVPQIWAIVNLFMRCPLERWEQYGPWLTVVQTAFNTADNTTKLEANYAWNRYVFLCLSETKLTAKSLTTLCQPLLSQLRKKATPKNPEDVTKLRRAAVGGACNLFYYAFRPGNDRHSPDMIWDVAVQPIMLQLTALGDSSDAQGDWTFQVAKLLNGLLDGATPRVWREDRIQDHTLVRSDELPPLDPKWIRRNCDKVLKVLDPIIERKILDLASQDSLVYRLWQSVVGAVAAASAKDIKVSDETVKFLAGAFGLFHRIWLQGPPRTQPEAASLLKGVRHMMQVMVNGLGILPFTEKKLLMTEPNLFEAVATPSARFERPDKSRGVMRSPLLHLLNLFCTIPEGAADDEEYAAFIRSIFEPFLAGKTDKARLDQARDLLGALPRNALCPYGIWTLLSQSFSLPFALPAAGEDKGNKILGPEYREMITFMERGLSCHPNLPVDQWLSTLDSVDLHVEHHFGHAGRALVIVEPLAKILVDLMDSEQSQIPDNTFFELTAKLLAITQFPKDKLAMDGARRQLWGAAPSASQHSPFRPLDYLFRAANLALKKAYGSLEVSNEEFHVIRLLEAVNAFVIVSKQFGEATLTALADGFRLWIADEKTLVAMSNVPQLNEAVLGLWGEVCQILVAIGQPNRGQLGALEPLLTSGCESNHPAILKLAAETWNHMVDKVDAPQCSDSLKSILSSLNSKLEVDMVSTPGAVDGSGAQPRLSLSHDTSHDALKPALEAVSEISNRGQRTSTSSETNSAIVKRSLNRRKDDVTPRRTRSRASKRVKTPNLRQDNSQIELTAVASASPLRKESRHLTERQKAVRERQQGHSIASPLVEPELNLTGTPEVATPETTREAIGSDAAGQPKDLTPERRTSYEDIISSTPTPRRGQVLQLDDLNDPPSSPPELRPYPLLTEIQTRSRTSDSLQGWEFSSPPNSPSASGPGAIARPDRFELAETRLDLRLPDQGEMPGPIAPPVEVSGKVDEAASQGKAKTGGALVTELPGLVVKQASPEIQVNPRRQKRGRPRKTSLVPLKSDGLSQQQRTLRSQSHDATQINLPRSEDPSFAPGDRSKSNTPQVVAVSAHVAEETARSTTPMVTRKRARTSACVGDDVVPSQAATDLPDGHMGDSKKRKIEHTKQAAGTDVRKKPSRDRYSSQQASSSSPGNASGSSGSQVRTRRSRRGRREQARETSDEEQGHALHDSAVDSNDPTKFGDDAGDTDEELLSQLMADSQAASQSQSQSRSTRLPSGDAGMKGEPEAEQVDQPSPETDENAVASVIALLCSGKDILQNTAISRVQVDELETMIMDLKREVYQAEYRGRDQ